MPRLLKDLQINDVSSVDRGAGEGVKILLMKRDTGGEDESALALKRNQSENLIDMTDLLRKSENKETDMTALNAEQIKKQIDDAVSAAMTATNEKVKKLSVEAEVLKSENAFLKMSPKHQAFAKDMSAEDKKKFAAKSDADKDDDCAKAEAAKVSKLDPEIQKRLDRADENEKVLKQLVEKDEIATFAKRAKEIGLTEADGEMLRKAHKGDTESLKAVEELVKRMNSAMTEAQRTGQIFKEFGTAIQSGGSTAYDQLTAKAAELRKSDKALSTHQAFAKVCEDPENAELVKQEKQERYTKMGAVVS